MSGFTAKLIRKKGGKKWDSLLPKEAFVKVGILTGAKGYPQGGPSLAEVAMWNEFGAPNAKRPIPSRPFFRTTLAEAKPRIMRDLGKSVGQMMLKAEPAEYMRKVLTLIGMELAAQVKQAIDNWSDPPNAPMTQAIKGNKAHLPVGTMVNNPLVDTGHLKQSMTYAVKVTK